MPHEPDAILFYDDTSRNSDLLWRSGFQAGDPFLYFERKGRKAIVASDLEIGRVRDQARVHTVLPLSRYNKRLKKRGIETPGPADVIAEIFRERKVEKVLVPGSTRIDFVTKLKKTGLKVRHREDPFFPEREIKTEEEIEKIRSAVRATEAAVTEGVAAIARSSIRRGKLYLDGSVLTSERVRGIIDGHLLANGHLGRGTIVAGGDHAVDPHNHGHGPLLAHRPIILDVFPKCAETGYHADMTRTVVRGRIAPRVREMYDAVNDACELAFDALREGVSGKAIHEDIQALFEDRGFRTGPRDGKMEGFFHGTGHGVGLEVHERPRISGAVDDTMRAGHVVTVEPGLYYPGLGGVRIEDLVVVRKDGCENLNSFEKSLELR
jgi:Xaa-Pro aminopeptidase